MATSPQRPADGRGGRAAPLAMLALPLVGSACLLLVASLRAQVPDWWLERGLISTNAPVATNDFAAANLGQLKHAASLAAEELEANLPGGAGSNILDMVAAWTNFAGADDFAALNLGQLKATAKPFYDRLIASGGWTNGYPWTTDTTADDEDFAPANVGQLKHAFAFEAGPGIPTEGLRLWLRADSGVTTNAAGEVELWVDRSGNTNDFAQGTAARRPSLSPASVAGHPAVTFDGADDSLARVGDNGSLDFTNGFLVAILRTDQSQPGYHGIAIRHWGYGFFVTDDRLTCYDWTGAGPTSFGQELDDDRPHFLGFEFDSGAVGGSRLFLDGTNSAPFTYTAVTGHPGVIGSGDQAGQCQFLAGDLAELLWYDRKLSDEELSSLRAYAVARYSPGDADWDGMSDIWEMWYFGSIEARPEDDADGDGISNIAEFEAGGDPQTPGSSSTKYDTPYFALWVYPTWSGEEFDYNSPTVNWYVSSAEPIESVVIERVTFDPQSGSSSGWHEIHRAGTGESEWVDSGCFVNRVYAYRISALSPAGVEMGPSDPVEYWTPEPFLACEKVSKTQQKHGIESYQATTPPKRFLKEVKTWTGLQGGNPESGPIGVGPGTKTRDVNPDTGAISENSTGEGSFNAFDPPTSPTTKSGQITLTSYNDPPNEVEDEPGTVSGTSTLSEENTTDAVWQRAVSNLPAFTGNFSSSAVVKKSINEAETSVAVGRLQYRFQFCGEVQNARVRWVERFYPQDNPNTPEDESLNYEDTERTWTGSGTETPVNMVDATVGENGTYEIIPDFEKVDLCLQGSSEGTEDDPGGILIANLDNDEGRLASQSTDGRDAFYTPDRELGYADHDDDIRSVSVNVWNCQMEGSVRLEAISGGDKIKLWKHRNKGEQLTLPAEWDLATGYPEPEYFIEGVQPSDSRGDVVLRLTYTRDGRIREDTVVVTVVKLNIGLVAYRKLPGVAGLNNLEHAGVVAEYVGAWDVDGLNESSNWVIIESGGKRAGDDLNLNAESTMRRIPLTSLIAVGGYQRGFSVEDLTDEKRNEILDRVFRLYERRTTLRYPLLGTVKQPFPRAIEWNGVDSTPPVPWDGTIESVTAIRCDAVAEVAYELSGVNVWGYNSGSPAMLYPIQTFTEEHQCLDPLSPDANTQLSPRAQRGGMGNQNTRMRRVPFFEPDVLITNDELKGTPP